MPMSSPCFVRVAVRERVALPPQCLGRIKHHVLEHFNAKVLKYWEALRGVLVSYSDVKVAQSLAHLVDEDHHLRFDVEATLVVFRPVIGAKLTGRLSKVSVDMAGCLVLDSFNASIARPPDADESWPGIEVGEWLTFAVEDITHSHGVLSITGVM